MFRDLRECFAFVRANAWATLVAAAVTIAFLSVPDVRDTERDDSLAEARGGAGGG